MLDNFSVAVHELTVTEKPVVFVSSPEEHISYPQTDNSVLSQDNFSVKRNTTDHHVEGHSLGFT